MKALLLIATLCVSTLASAQAITGAGATFPAPLYAGWADAYNKATGVRINYQSVGSGAGIRQIQSRTIDFGASDMPLTDAALQQHGLVQFPTVIGSVVPVVNIAGIKPGQLKLTGPILADIYLGKITSWTDPAIKTLNPSLKLPGGLIVPIRRADGSGTTFLFTNYLSKVSPEFKQTIGEGTAVNWKVGAGGKGNEGVAAFVARLQNSIGYVEHAYVKQNNLTYVSLQNAAGSWTTPTDEALKDASASATWDKTFYQVLTNQPGKNAWPIVGATFILMHKQQATPEKGAAVIQFFEWTAINGDKTASDLGYVPLPPSVKELNRKLWSTIK